MANGANIASRAWALIQAEPVAAQGIVQAGIAMLCGFGLNWSGQQIALVMTFSAAVLAFVTRKTVTANVNQGAG